MKKIPLTKFTSLLKYQNSILKNKANIPQNSGEIAEQLASNFLKKHNLQLISKNYNCRQGEIDLIMQDDKQLVFIEVRYRKHQQHGTALETISHHKLKRIKAAINHYIMTNNLGYISCRVDVIGLQGNLDRPTIDWQRNIFID